MNKKALKEVGMFWLLFLGLFGYVGLIVLCAINMWAIGIALMIAPVFVLVSVDIYCELVDEQERKSKKVKK